MVKETINEHVKKSETDKKGYLLKECFANLDTVISTTKDALFNKNTIVKGDASSTVL